MQAIPSTTPLSRTAAITSSVMSVRVSPPAVRRRVSCWKTFIAVAILREALPGAGGDPSTLSGSCRSPPLVALAREALIEEPAEQEHGTDGEERECPGDRAERRQVVEEDLGEADGEEGEACDPERVPPLLQADVQQREPEHAPEGADRRVATLELGLQSGVGDPGEELEDQQREPVDGEPSGDPPRHRPVTAELAELVACDPGRESDRDCGDEDRGRAAGRVRLR